MKNAFVKINVQLAIRLESISTVLPPSVSRIPRISLSLISYSVDALYLSIFQSLFHYPQKCKTTQDNEEDDK